MEVSFNLVDGFGLDGYSEGLDFFAGGRGTFAGKKTSINKNVKSAGK